MKNLDFIASMSLCVVMIFSASKYAHTSESGDMIYWPGTPSYESRLKEFSISIEEADQLLVSKTRNHPDRFFDRTPIFIVGDEYFFAEPSKQDILLQGFFVNANTGKIEYRKSSVFIKSKQKRFPKDAFSEIQLIE